jgi:membrane protein implicated in regulation of membrane protease activity
LDALDILALAIVILLAVAILGWYLYSVKWAPFKKHVTGPESLIGKPGIVVAPIERDKMGEVNVDGIIWKARVPADAEAYNSKLTVGQSVVVIGYADLTVVVKKSE